MTHGHDASSAEYKRNTARFFVEHRQVGWVLLVATLLWGAFAYYQMPKRKDPVFPSRTAVAVCVWPGVSAEKIEALVTRKIEAKIAENPTTTKIESIVRTSVTIVYFNIDERIADTSAQFDDVKLRLDGITDLPSGTQPIIFLKDFADTAALMLTVASPPVSGPELELKAAAIQQAITDIRGGARPGRGRASLVVSFPQSLAANVVERPGRLLAEFFQDTGFGKDLRVRLGPGFFVLDGELPTDDAAILREAQQFIQERLHVSEFHPDVWQPAVVRNPADTHARLTVVAGDKYSYRQLDEFTDLMQKTMQTLPAASKVQRSGVLEQRIYLDYSQQRLAAYGLHTSAMPRLFATRNTAFPGGILEVGSKNITIDPSGELTNEHDISSPTAYKHAIVDVRFRVSNVLGPICVEVSNYGTSRIESGCGLHGGSAEPPFAVAWKNGDLARRLDHQEVEAIVRVHVAYGYPPRGATRVELDPGERAVAVALDDRDAVLAAGGQIVVTV